MQTQKPAGAIISPGKPAVRFDACFKGSSAHFGATKEDFLANMRLVKEKWPGFGHAYLEHADKGRMERYPEGRMIMSVLEGMVALRSQLAGMSFKGSVKCLDSPLFLVPSLFEWPSEQWGALSKNADLCKGNPKLDEVFVYYMESVAQGNGKLDYTPALEKCAKHPKNMAGSGEEVEILPFLRPAEESCMPRPFAANAARLEESLEEFTHLATIVCGGRPVRIIASDGYHSDGVDIFLPVSEYSRQTAEENRSHMHNGLIHESWHIRYGSFRLVAELIEGLDKLGAKIEVRNEPKTGKSAVFLTAIQGKRLESEKAVSSLMNLLDAFERPDIAIALLNTVEDGRIEFYGTGYFIGLQENYLEDNRKSLELRPIIKLDGGKMGLSEVLEYITQKTIVKSTSNEFQGQQVPPEVVARAKKVLGMFLAVQQRDMRAEDSFNAVIHAYLDLQDLIEKMPKDSKLGSWSKTPGKTPDKIEIVSDPGEQQKLRTAGAKASGSSSKDSESGGDLGDFHQDENGGPCRLRNDKGESPLEGNAGSYREWDENLQAYHDHFAVVNEVPATEAPQAASPLLSLVFEEGLMHLKPRGWVRLRHQRSGTVDVQEAQRQYIDFVASGKQIKGDFYSRMKKEERSVAVAVLLDASASTEEETIGGRVIDVENELASAFLNAVSSVGDPNAFYSFNSEGAQATRFYVCKDFGDDRVRGIVNTPKGANRDGAAIRHATAKLMDRPERIKMLVIISDTQPADNSYNDSYAIADTGMAVKEAELAGVSVFGISVSENHDYMNRIYSPNRFICVRSADQIRSHIGRIFQEMTGGMDE